jgi:hypothetical protein
VTRRGWYGISVVKPDEFNRDHRMAINDYAEVYLLWQRTISSVLKGDVIWHSVLIFLINFTYPFIN